jgi:hypothetical protein
MSLAEPHALSLRLPIQLIKTYHLPACFLTLTPIEVSSGWIGTACDAARILSMLAHDLVHDSVDVDGCERPKLVQEAGRAENVSTTGAFARRHWHTPRARASPATHATRLEDYPPRGRCCSLIKWVEISISLAFTRTPFCRGDKTFAGWLVAQLEGIGCPDAASRAAAKIYVISRSTADLPARKVAVRSTWSGWSWPAEVLRKGRPSGGWTCTAKLAENGLPN